MLYINRYKLTATGSLKPLWWVGSSKKDLMTMPEEVVDLMGYTLQVHRKNEMTRITRGSANVFADLGLPDAERMLVKSHLATAITTTIARRGLTQTAAAAIVGMPQPKLSGMLRGEFRGISEAKMLACLNRLGHDVEIVVREPEGRKRRGRTRVVRG